MARTTYRYWVFVGILVFVHFALRVGFGLEDRAPDLLTVATLFGARRLRSTGAALLGLLLGVLADALSLIAFGASAVALAIVGFLGARSRDMFEGDSLVFVTIYLFLGVWLRQVIQVLVSRQGIDWSVLYTSAPLVAAYAALAGIVALGVFRAVTDER
jgi:rod shape-determining protein MreD